MMLIRLCIEGAKLKKGQRPLVAAPFDCIENLYLFLNAIHQRCERLWVIECKVS